MAKRKRRKKYIKPKKVHYMLHIGTFCQRLIYATISCIGNITSPRLNMKGTNEHQLNSGNTENTHKFPDQTSSSPYDYEHVMMRVWDDFGDTVKRAIALQWSRVVVVSSTSWLAVWLDGRLAGWLVGWQCLVWSWWCIMYAWLVWVGFEIWQHDIPWICVQCSSSFIPPILLRYSFGCCSCLFGFFFWILLCSRLILAMFYLWRYPFIHSDTYPW